MRRKRKFGCLIILLITFLIILITGFFVIRNITRGSDSKLTNNIEEFLSKRQEQLLDENKETTDPFGKDNIASILFIGLDSRAGQTNGHCDAIQLIEINKDKETVTITAVSRGTPSQLPPGIGTTSTDYYVSNACGLVNLEYGVKQIQYVLGKKPDYIMVVGFSEVMGILNYLDLPTTPTLQWLRHRQGYSIGEPQRAHNHSTFLKKLITNYIPEDTSTINAPLHYIVYKLIQTDLSFEQSREIIEALSKMKLNEDPDRISLAMRPFYPVQDIEYDPEQVEEYLKTMIEPIKHLLSKDDYTATTPEDIQSQLLNIIGKQKEDPEFLAWAFENNIWLQIQDETIVPRVQYDIISAYIPLLSERSKRMQILSDYIIEMDYRGFEEWSDKGKELLSKELPT
ncbi:hypothetical protein HOF40_02135 [Candidatus Parcubacteria bacterium]|jgi:anionic cell wall polymer biosynthesis LytR-Cps2A-Psr (LCP) family protein|nr:hypothetical protein [Candidatus Parcubacteria bacterium]MBT3948864.1 hypothetical protein [Candidatus Parcubacteria bacterium]